MLIGQFLFTFGCFHQLIVCVVCKQKLLLLVTQLFGFLIILRPFLAC